MLIPSPPIASLHAAEAVCFPTLPDVVPCGAGTSQTLDDIGKRGAVRVRYSLEWTAAERRRLVAYASPPPLFCTPIESRSIAEAVKYALYGGEEDADAKFVLARFKSHTHAGGPPNRRPWPGAHSQPSLHATACCLTGPVRRL